jgi:hypothetical protein
MVKHSVLATAMPSVSALASSSVSALLPEWVSGPAIRNP